MTVKKTKWLWSYSMEKTEAWFAEMAAKGLRLCSFNPMTRRFTFEEGSPNKAIFQIQRQAQLFPTLVEAGWQEVASSGKWKVIMNEREEISCYPSIDEVLKRNRFHAYLFAVIALFLSSFHLPLLLITMSVSSVGVFLVGIPIVLLDVFAIYIYWKYRQFEQKVMDARVDRIHSGEKIRKLKLGWMYIPYEITNWLEEMAKKGYELESVTAAMFTFRRSNPGNIKYECTFEGKVQPYYYAIHKEAGWQLKYTSNMTWLNYSIWAKPYDKGEELPQLTYDVTEQKKSMKKAFSYNFTIGALLIWLLSFNLYTNFLMMESGFFEWSVKGVLQLLLMAVSFLWITLFIKMCFSFYRSMKRLKGISV